jgi:serine/threonine protein kinase
VLLGILTFLPLFPVSSYFLFCLFIWVSLSLSVLLLWLAQHQKYAQLSQNTVHGLLILTIITTSNNTTISSFERGRQMFFVMEFNAGGDLYERMPYSEKQAADITNQIVSAIRYLHAQNVCHRDLKVV